MTSRWFIPFLILLASPLHAHAEPVEVELDSLRPGLLASYRSLIDPNPVLTRIDPKPAFTLGHSSPHPRLPAGPFEAVWTGVLLFKETAPVTFDAFVSGELKMEVDGIVVLEGNGASDTSRIIGKQTLEREPGLYRLKITYRSVTDRPARLQIGWQSKGFSREPLPAWLLAHLPTELPAAAQLDTVAARGQQAIGKLGCARCHAGALPGVTEPPPGPALHDLGRRVRRDWLLTWLADPAQLRPGAHMPHLFAPDRNGFVERWLIADHLLSSSARQEQEPPGDHRAGRLTFLNIGCIACHSIPDWDQPSDPSRQSLIGLGDRLPADDLASFLGQPHARYPDGRMPKLPLTPEQARNIAAYLLLWSKPTDKLPIEPPPTEAEIETVRRKVGGRTPQAAGAALLRSKGCADCHPGLGNAPPADVPMAEASKGCLSDKSLPRFALDAETLKAIKAYLQIAAKEKHPSPFAARQRQLERIGCVRCHQRDTDRPPPLEALASTLGGAYLQSLPFQRTPRLTYPHQKYSRDWLTTAVRDGVTGLRPDRYSYRMPSFGHETEALVQALAEADGELPAAPEPPTPKSDDPTLATVSGLTLVGFQGYACVSCHMWNGRMLNESDPGAVGPDLTRVLGRIRRDWFDRFLEDPARSHPRTPMPAIFRKGQGGLLTSVLDGDQAKQTEALWAYLALGKAAPSPKPPPPLPITVSAGDPSLVAQIPIRLPEGKTALESISILTPGHDLLVYDLGTMAPHSLFTGGRILRGVQGRLRTYAAEGMPLNLAVGTPLQWVRNGQAETPAAIRLHGYDRLPDGVRLRWQADAVEVVETLRIEDQARQLIQVLRFEGIPAGQTLLLRGRGEAAARIGTIRATMTDGIQQIDATPADGKAEVQLQLALPPARTPPPLEKPVLAAVDPIEGALERPGFRAIAYPRPQTILGGDRLMPAAVAAHPRTGKVFVASMKTGELFTLHDPTDDGKQARFDLYAHGLFQEAYSMRAEDDALYVLHRRNLTRIADSDGDGRADRFDRVIALPHGVADTYDYGYGLTRDKSGAFVYSFAPYANTTLPGSGGALRFVPGKPPDEVAFGFRNPVGWCAGPDGEIFFTDNQGEWVATNKLCHLSPRRFFGFPNPAQRQHAQMPAGKAAIWVPYAWARSINGVTYDHTGKFGPFGGQIFMAELMYGGAIIRANLEKVNGEYQGACFPFWGRGLLGPVSLSFDPKGRLWVGGITEPGWMAQPDRGALFRIDYTGKVPFEMQSIHVRPRGFRIRFTRAVDAATARDPAFYQIEHYRYEYTGAYGSPELDRTRVKVDKVELSADGLSADLTLPLVKDRIYLIQGKGLRSTQGEPLAQPAGAYTLNEIPVR